MLRRPTQRCPDYFGIDAPDHVDVNKPLNFRLDKCDMDGASQIKWGVAKGESAPPETWTTVKDEQQRVSYTPTSTGTYTIWAYCANVSGERVSDSGSSSFTSYSTKATMNPTKWAADEYVRMVTKGFNSSDTLSASLVRDGDTKDYGDLLDSQRIWYQWASETSDFTFPGNVPVGDYTLTFTDHGNTARTVRVHLDHGAGYLLSGDTPKPTPTPTPKPTPTPTPAPTSGEATVKPVPGAATTSAATVVTDGSDQGVVRVAGGLGTLPHTGV